MTNLYTIANQYQELLANTFDPETGEVNEQAVSELATIGDTINDKGIAVASYIKNLEAERDAIANAKKNMADRERSLSNKMDYLTDYLRSNMERCGITEISCPQFAIKIKQCPWSTDIINEEFIPDRYKKIKEVVTLDRVKIKEDILAGLDVPGANVQKRVRLEIR